VKGKENKKERSLGGVKAHIPQPKRREFLNKVYKNTDIWDNSTRHPLLCLRGHYSWHKGSDKTPSSFTIVTPYTLSTLKSKIEKGDYIIGANFQHWINELDKCECRKGRELGDTILTEQRKATLASRSIGHPVLQKFDEKYELKYYLQKRENEVQPGVHDIKNIDTPGRIFPSDLKDRVSLWLLSRESGYLPRNCAGFLCFEACDENSNLFIPDTGGIVLIIPKSKKEEFVIHLKKLKEKIDAVKMGPGNADTLKEDLKDYSQGSIEWSDSDSQEEVKKFIEEITNLEMRKIRSTRPLAMEIFDENYEFLTPVSKERITDFSLSSDLGYYLKIRRLRNAPLEGFRILFGPGIVGTNLSFTGLEATSLGIDDESGGILWKIFVRDKTLQNGVWAKISLVSNTDDAWIEIFDHGSSVEQSGMRIQIVPEGSL